MHRKIFRAVTLKPLRDLYGSRKVYKKFADDHTMVYFGTVGIQDEEFKLVKGITLSNAHQDTHYCMGASHGHDIIMVQRKDVLSKPGIQHDLKKESYTWNILRVDMSESTELSHVFLDARNHGPAFYHMIDAKSRHLQPVPPEAFRGHDKKFVKEFRSLANLSSFDEFFRLLKPETTSVLAHHFTNFDFEWHRDELYVYFLSKRPTYQQLEQMLTAGIWLAGELEQAYESSTTNSTS